MNLASTGNSPRSVMGNSSLVLKERDGGGVITELQRNSPHAELIATGDLAPLVQTMHEAQRDAQSLSHGSLSTAQLAKMGHPYGIGRRRGLGRLQGRRRGVSNRDVVNQQSGALAHSWSSGVTPNSKGALLFLANSAPEARFVAFGTPRMKAHGPFESAVKRQLPSIERQWQAVSQAAQKRHEEAEALVAVGEMSLHDLSFSALSTQGPSARGVQRAQALGLGHVLEHEGGL